MALNEPDVKKARLDQDGGPKCDFYADLTSWLSSASPSASFSQIRVQPTPNAGNGLFATCDFKSDSIIATIPHEAVLTPDKVRSSDIGKAMADRFPFSFIMSVYLASAKASNDHPFGAFIKSLPEVAPNAPWWDETPRSLLEGTNLGAAVGEFRTDLVKHFEKAREALGGIMSDIDLELLQWAAGVYDSRRLPLRLGTKNSAGKEATDDQGIATGEGVMVPLLDQGNHSMESAITWDTDENGVNFRSKKPISKGSEIFNHYGFKSNEELLMAYGFCIQNNPHESYGLLMSVGTEPPPAPQKKLGPFQLRLPNNELFPQFPPELWRALADPMNYEPSAQWGEGLDSDQAPEVDQEDVQFLLATLQHKLKRAVDLQDAHASRRAAHGDASVCADGKEETARQCQYVGWYLDGQVEVLEKAAGSLLSMLGDEVADEEELEVIHEED